jgi:hypothetical protein
VIRSFRDGEAEKLFQDQFSKKCQAIERIARRELTVLDEAETLRDIAARYMLETLGSVYHNDAVSRERELSPEDRLRFHQEHSGPLMKALHEWMESQFAEHNTEPNSGLGKAISYLLNHWSKLTLFLRQPGSPIDNNNR